MAVRGESSGRGAVDPVEPDLARSIRSWMRAYPRRWRAARGEEMFGLVADLARPGARRLSARSSIDLLRGGWATRWRERPPLHTWLLYRMFDKRIPVSHRAWALDDIDGYWFQVRQFVGSAWIVLVNPFLWSRDPQAARGWWGFFAVVFVGTMFIMPEKRRRTARLKHVAARPGELVFEGELVAQDGPRTRATARSALTWAVLFLGTVAVAVDGSSRLRCSQERLGSACCARRWPGGVYADFSGIASPSPSGSSAPSRGRAREPRSSGC